MGIAAAIATAIAVKAVNAINKYGEPIGVSATKGTEFMGMSWGAVAAMLVAMLVAVYQVVAGRRERKQSFRQSKI